MNVARAFNNWRKNRQTFTEMGGTSRSNRDDLGVHRNEICSVVRAAMGL